MEYKGKLYGHLGGRVYFDTGKITDDWDTMEKRITELEAENQLLRQSFGIPPLPCQHNFVQKDSYWRACTHCGMLIPLEDF